VAGAWAVGEYSGAYRADLTALARWLEERDSALLKATRIELLGFIARGSRADRGPDRRPGSCRVSAAFFVS